MTLGLETEGMLLFVAGVGVAFGGAANLLAGRPLPSAAFPIAFVVWAFWFTKWAVTGGLPASGHR